MGLAGAVLGLLLAAGVGLAAPAALEQAYEGTQEAGGPVRLTVQTEPPQIIAFEVEGVAGGGCSWDTITLENWGGPLAVVDDHFGATNADGDVLDGAWVAREPAGTRIEGTITLHDPIKGCETPPLRWVAVLTPAP
ncbi:MAG: hypothetical protein AB7K36_11200 [Chloroflexota bacterium]